MTMQFQARRSPSESPERTLRNKLKYEIDSYDLWDSITLGKDIVVVDARSSEANAELLGPIPPLHLPE